jgi:hypothetical protein
MHHSHCTVGNKMIPKILAYTSYVSCSPEIRQMELYCFIHLELDVQTPLSEKEDYLNDVQTIRALSLSYFH